VDPIEAARFGCDELTLSHRPASESDQQDHKHEAEEQPRGRTTGRLHDVAGKQRQDGERE